MCSGAQNENERQIERGSLSDDDDALHKRFLAPHNAKWQSTSRQHVIRRHA